ncbi:fimbrial biogenesis chaperone [Rosenbergiella epipactidis]|uniref:fimbrial biogenesis chaperone n=1 Tax=Rosenbergiella epipactidis TaxID=1544694 RepID=UPI001F502CB3|nr:molecular chaperone [Rosenbergiella epipactidis]
MLRFCLPCIIMIISFYSQAGIEIGGTRLIYNSNSRQVSISVRNPDDTPYLIQAWVTKENTSTDVDNNFIATPPLFRIEPHSQSEVRLVYTGKNLPTDRESMFWLSIKSIPSSQNNDVNKLLVSVKSMVKLFYRPAGLNGSPGDAYEKLTFIRNGDKFDVSNPTPYYISIYDLSIGGVSIKKPITLSPLSKESFPLTSKTSSQVSWQSITDFGGISERKTTNFK